MNESFDPRAELAELKALQVELDDKRDAYLSILRWEMHALRQASEEVFKKAVVKINEELQPLHMQITAITYPHREDGTPYGAFSSLNFRLSEGLNDVLALKAPKNGDPDENYEALVEFRQVAEPFIKAKRLAMSLESSLAPKQATAKVTKL